MIFPPKAGKSRQTQGRKLKTDFPRNSHLCPGSWETHEGGQSAEQPFAQEICAIGSWLRGDRSLAFWGSAGSFFLRGGLCGRLKMNPVAFRNLADWGASVVTFSSPLPSSHGEFRKQIWAVSRTGAVSRACAVRRTDAVAALLGLKPALVLSLWDALENCRQKGMVWCFWNAW